MTCRHRNDSHCLSTNPRLLWVLLYRAGNYIQSLVREHGGGSYQKKSVYTYTYIYIIYIYIIFIYIYGWVTLQYSRN